MFVLQEGGKRGCRLASPTLGAFSNHQTVSDRVLDDGRTIFSAELFQDPGTIGAERRSAGAQRPSALHLIGVSLPFARPGPPIPGCCRKGLQ